MSEIRTASPYLFFNGHCEEAINFYEEALGAQVEAMMRFSDAPGGSGPPGMPEAMQTKIMHAAFKIGGTSIMASDGMCTEGSRPNFDGFALSLTMPDVAAAETVFAALAATGKISQPLIETFFAPRFGIVADKFGLSWMVVVDAPPTP